MIKRNLGRLDPTFDGFGSGGSGTRNSFGETGQEGIPASAAAQLGASGSESLMKSDSAITTKLSKENNGAAGGVPSGGGVPN